MSRTAMQSVLKTGSNVVKVVKELQKTAPTTNFPGRSDIDCSLKTKMAAINVKSFFRRNLLWHAGLLAAIPLIVILGLQYVSLVKLRRAAANDQRLSQQKYLEILADKIWESYETRSEALLSFPEADFDDDAKVAAHFEKLSWGGARLLFVVRLRSPAEPQILFYNSTKRGLESHPDWSDARKIRSAAASWSQLSRDGVVVQPKRVRVTEVDPETRIMLVPATNAASQVTGVTGLFIDHDYFRNRFLPRAIAAYQSESSFIHRPDQVILTVRDSSDRVVFQSGPAGASVDEVSVRMKFLFTDWHLGIQSGNWTPERWAQVNFYLTLSVSLLMTVLLVGAIALTLRTASREMELSRMKAEFVSNVSHELRTPLASIRVFGEFFRLGWIKDPQKISECGGYIEAESRRLTQLIGNILDFSRIESSQKTYEFRRADVRAVILEAVGVLRVRLSQSGMVIKLEDARAPLPLAFIDSDAIGQAFMNLVDNAVKYSGSEREILVRIELEAGHIVVSVTDHGIGIPPGERQRIFEKFYRVSTGLVHDVKGSGLGLAIVKHIVDAHRGKVTVESAPGRGTTFAIRLPVIENSSNIFSTR